jgi:hypothetical protein
VIKYRALLCVEQGLVLNDPEVDAILVAGSFPEPVKGFCRQYDVITRKFSIRY